MGEEIESELNLKEEKKLAKEFAIGKLSRELESEDEITTIKKLKKSKNINIENVSLEESVRAKSIVCGDVTIVSSNDDKLRDLFGILKKISENKNLMNYLSGGSKKNLTFYD